MTHSLDRWVGKIAIVTGASSGIGASIAKLLVENGIIVVGIVRRVKNIEDLSKELASKKGKLYAVKADLTQEPDILKAFEWVTNNLGLPHILINNAGYSNLNSHLSDGKTEIWKKIFDLNVLGLCIATREAVKIMKANNINGHIIHINSMSGHRVPIGFRMNVYPASKYAVTALTESLRQELNSFKSKIKVSSISPGLVKSEMTIYNKEMSEERKKVLESRPILEAEDIANAVLYVLSTPEHVQVHELKIMPVGQP